MTESFTDVDVFYLANSFNQLWLRREVRIAELRASVRKEFLGTEYQTTKDLFPWTSYADACREAIEWQRASKPASPPPAGRIDPEAIKAKNDIVVVIEGYTKLRKSGSRFTGRCPLHDDKSPSMTVYPDQQTFHCYGCQAGGDVIAFIQAAENTDFKGAAAILGA